jgi:ATP-dependent DNA helicase RecG
VTAHENQAVEWKESWRDEYLKWICAFANTGGGVLEIGRNDRGKVVGVAEPQHLLEIIPNKARDILGVVVDVHIRHEQKLEYVTIAVDSYPNPVSYRGQYYVRSGSTIQELRGATLDHFILKKLGKR